MRNGIRLTLLLLALVLADGVLLFALTRATEFGALAARFVSLGLGAAMAVVLNRLLSPRMALANQPGLRPLLAVVVLLDYGIFAALAIRAPEIQPLAHFGASWLASLAFLFVGLRRIRRWRDET
jgi:asparagine N-glycosylation enzyme membrane subunit Stt3